MNSYWQIARSFWTKNGWLLLVIGIVVTYLRPLHQNASRGVGAEEIEFFKSCWIWWMILLWLSWICGRHLGTLTATPYAALIPEIKSKALQAVCAVALILLLAGIWPIRHQSMNAGIDIQLMFSLYFLTMSIVLLTGYYWNWILPMFFCPFYFMLIVIHGNARFWAELICVVSGCWLLTVLKRRVYAVNEDCREYVENHYSIRKFLKKQNADPTAANGQPGWGEMFYDYHYKDLHYSENYYAGKRIPRRYLQWRGALGPYVNPVFSLLVCGLPMLLAVPFYLTMAFQPEHSLKDDGFSFGGFLFFLWIWMPGGRGAFLSTDRSYLPLELALPYSRRDYVRTMGGLSLFFALATFACFLLLMFPALLIAPAHLRQPALWKFLFLLPFLNFFLFSGSCLFDSYPSSRRMLLRVSAIIMLYVVVQKYSGLLMSSGTDWLKCWMAAAACIFAGYLMLRQAYRNWMRMEVQN